VLQDDCDTLNLNISGLRCKTGYFQPEGDNINGKHKPAPITWGIVISQTPEPVSYISEEAVPSFLHVDLQALVTTAFLHAFVHIPTTLAKRKADTDKDRDMSEQDLMRHIWTLCRSDIDNAPEPAVDVLKIVKLTKEVVRIS
jgi:hypothetical protein